MDVCMKINPWATKGQNVGNRRAEAAKSEKQGFPHQGNT